MKKEIKSKLDGRTALIKNELVEINAHKSFLAPFHPERNSFRVATDDEEMARVERETESTKIPTTTKKTRCFS